MNTAETDFNIAIDLLTHGGGALCLLPRLPDVQVLQQGGSRCPAVLSSLSPKMIDHVLF
jgi:hypothetical protein